MFKDVEMGSELHEGSIYQIRSGKKILSHPGYVEYSEAIFKIANLKKNIFDALYSQLMQNYAQFVQQLEKPRDKMGEMLLHSSFRRAYGFIRQVAPIVWSNQGFGFDPDRLIYALYSAALLHGIGRCFQDRSVVLCDQHGKFVSAWFPVSGPMQEGYYKVRATRSLPDDYVIETHLIYAQAVLPSMGMAWIMEDPKLFLWWKKALEDMQAGFGDLEIDLDIEKLAKGVGEEFDFEATHPENLPAETLEGEKFLAWLKEKIKRDKNAINRDGSGLYHTKDGLLVEIDQLISEYADSEHVGKASQSLIRSQFESLGVAGSVSSYSKRTGGFLQSQSQQEFQAMLIEYEKGLFETGALGPVLQIASQTPISSSERFFARIGGVAMQFMLGHTSKK